MTRKIPRPNNKILTDKIRKIKLFLTDVDGVLTDGGMYYTNEGLVMKKFQVKDGMGSYLLREKGIKVGLISSDKAPIGRIRGERLEFHYIYTGDLNKLPALEEICQKEGISFENVGYIGDDVNDRDIIKVVGFSACPNDAVESIKEIVDYTCSKKGGHGAYREVVDLILATLNEE